MKEIKIIFTTEDEFSRELLNDLKKYSETGEISKERKRVISFDGPETLCKTLTTQRLGMLSVIKKLRPESMYQLAMMLHRDQASVLRDCKVLYHAGLINLKKSIKDGRKVLVPMLVFDYDRIVMPIGNFYLDYTETDNEVKKAS